MCRPYDLLKGQLRPGLRGRPTVFSQPLLTLSHSYFRLLKILHFITGKRSITPPIFVNNQSPVDTCVFQTRLTKSRPSRPFVSVPVPATASIAASCLPCFIPTGHTFTAHASLSLSSFNFCFRSLHRLPLLLSTPSFPGNIGYFPKRSIEKPLSFRATSFSFQ